VDLPHPYGWRLFLVLKNKHTLFHREHQKDIGGSVGKACEQNTKHDNELLSTESVARSFNLALATFKKWRQLGIGPAWYLFGTKDGVGPGRCVVRYRRGEVESYIRLHRVTPTGKRSNVHQDMMMT
jgi:hypothetical protein